MGKANRGSFRPGFDPRRHVFSQAERRKGYEQATQTKRLSSRVRAWLRSKIRGYYARKKDGTLPSGPGWQIPPDQLDF